MSDPCQDGTPAAKALEVWSLVHCVSPYREKHTHTKPYIKQSLHLGFGNFNQRLDNITLPTGRQSFTFGAFFNQSLDNKTFQSLIFGFIYI